MLSSLPAFCDPATAKTLADEISFVLGRTGNGWRDAGLAAQFIQIDVKLRLTRCMAGNARQRAAIHVAVVRAILADYLQLWDDERDVADLVNDAVRELADLAPPATVADDREKGFRREILREILEIQLWDAYHGGQYMGDTAERRLQSLATPEERAWLLAELLASFARHGGPDYQFGRQCVGRIGLSMAGDSLSGEEMEGLLRAAGLSSELAQRLLARGAVEGALQVLRGADGRQVGDIVKAFYAVGQGDVAAKAALQHPALADPECGGLGAELAAVGVEVPKTLLELNWAVSSLVSRPGSTEYRRMRELAVACDRWPAVLDSVVFRSENSTVVPLLARMHAARGDAVAAREVLGRLKESVWTSAALDVAEELEASQPLVAAEVLREVAAMYEARGTKQGREAAGVLLGRVLGLGVVG